MHWLKLNTIAIQLWGIPNPYPFKPTVDKNIFYQIDNFNLLLYAKLHLVSKRRLKIFIPSDFGPALTVNEILLPVHLAYL